LTDGAEKYAEEDFADSQAKQEHGCRKSPKTRLNTLTERSNFPWVSLASDSLVDLASAQASLR